MHVNLPGLAILAVIVGVFLYRMLKGGGFKAAMFGARIDRTLGEVKGVGRIANVKLRVHALSSNGEDRAVGIELVATTIASYQMLPITLSKEGANNLIALLHEAAGDTP